MTNHDQFEMLSLSTSLMPLVDHFNAHQDKVRLMAVLSPTCPR